MAIIAIIAIKSSMSSERSGGIKIKESAINKRSLDPFLTLMSPGSLNIVSGFQRAKAQYSKVEVAFLENRYFAIY